MRILAGLLFTVCLFAATPAYAADRVVVRFSNSADSADRSAARDSVDATSAKPLTGLTGVQVVTVPEGDAKSAARTLDNRDGVLWAQPEHILHAQLALPSTTGSASEEQWGLLNHGQDILDQYGTTWTGTSGVDGDFTPAWDRGLGAGQTIAVVDTGVDFAIGDLAVNRGAGGYDFVDGDTDPAPDPAGGVDTSHGTHVAGIAAASLGVHESSDITGGAPGARIMALRALDGSGSGSTVDIAGAFSWAASHGARVVNASLGAPIGYDYALHQAIASHPNTLFVVAAGNGDPRTGTGYNEDAQLSGARDYPCADPSPNVVCVAALASTGVLADFSNYGATTVDVAAPGVAIYSYLLGGALEPWDGTSMATPYVSAAAALAFAAHPSATPSQIRSLIIASAHHLGSLTGKLVSGGMLDAAQLVARAAALPTPKPTPVAPKPTPAPAPVSHPAPALAPASPKLWLAKPHRRGSKLALSGRVSRSFHGTVTIKVCVGRRCRTARVKAHRGAFSARVRPSRRGRVVITASVRAGAGFKAARAKRTVRF